MLAFAYGKFNQSRQNIEHRERAQQCAGGESREMRVVPYPKKLQQEVDGKRTRGNEEPLASGRSCVPERLKQRVTNDANQETGIYPRASGTNSKRMLGDEKRTSRNLMANVTERDIDVVRD